MANQELLNALKRELHSISFRAGRGCLLEGDWGMIHIAPTRPDNRGRCRLDIRVAMQSLPAETDPPGTGGWQTELEQLKDHQDLEMRESAAIYAAALKRPRVGPEDLAGIKIELARSDGQPFLAYDVTDRHGCCQIPNVDADLNLSVLVGEGIVKQKKNEEELWKQLFPPGTEETESAREALDAALELHGFAAFTHPVYGDTAEASETRIESRDFQVAGFTLTVEKADDGDAVLIAQTNDGDLAKKCDAFKVGDQLANVSFEEIPKKRVWSARTTLPMKFKDFVELNIIPTPCSGGTPLTQE